MASSSKASNSAIVGIGQTEFSKNIGRPERTVALEAIRSALQDAGLDSSQVDGLVRFDMETTTEVEIARNLGLENVRFFSEIAYGGGAGCGTVAHAAMAVATGQASVVVCWRARNRGSGGRPWAATGSGVGGDAQFTAPYGLVRPVDDCEPPTSTHAAFLFQDREAYHIHNPRPKAGFPFRAGLRFSSCFL